MKASVIIPTYNRGQLLDATLNSLVNQDCAPFDFEVIVIDDESTDNTNEVIQSYEAQLPLRHEKITRVGYNVSRPRNVGIQMATGNVAVFLDSGLVVGPEFLRLHLNTHVGPRPRYCIGHTLGAMREEPWIQGCNTYDVKKYVQLFGDRPEFDDPRRRYVHSNHSSPWIFFWGDNSSVPLEAIKSAGGFDEAVCGWGFEDLELGYRLYKNGLEFAICDAWAVHLPHPRTPLHERMAENSIKWRYALGKHRSLELEIFSITDAKYYDYTYNHTQMVASQIQIPDYCLPSYQSELLELKNMVAQPALVAGCIEPLAFKDFGIGTFLMPQNTRNRQGNQSETYSLLGFQTPFAAKQFKTLIITDYWKQLGGSPSPERPSYLLYLMAESTRIAERILIVDTPNFIPNVPDGWKATRRELRQAINSIGACPIDKPASFNVIPSSNTGFWESY